MFQIGQQVRLLSPNNYAGKVGTIIGKSKQSTYYGIVGPRNVFRNTEEWPIHLIYKIRENYDFKLLAGHSYIFADKDFISTVELQKRDISTMLIQMYGGSNV